MRASSSAATLPMYLGMTLRRRIRTLRSESGFMIVELLIAMTFLVVAVGALMALYASTIVDLRHSSTEGNALTLADKQMEVYKTLPFSGIIIDSSTIPSGSDPYVTAHSTDVTIPSSSGQVTGGTIGSSACSAPTQAQAQCATQNWTGPDGLAYRVDSYIVSATPSGGGRTVKEVTVVVRKVVSGTVGAGIWARATSAFDQSNPPQ